MPELKPYGRQAVRIEAEPGVPAVGDSSLGGPLLWPRTDPWPTCSEPDDTEESGLPACAMVPVAQIVARDVPGPWWPAGFDVLQILWCPNTHADGLPALVVSWRDAATVRGILTSPPAPVRHDEDHGYVLAPCLVRVEQVMDFPFREELPEPLRPKLQQLIKQTDPEGKDLITRLPGWKIGGWPTWHLTSPMTFACSICGKAMVLLFTIASDDTVGITVGRFGELRLFVCPDHHQEIHADLH
jgi:hypothetical protein